MEKLFTFTLIEKEVDIFEQLIKDCGDLVLDFDKSKTFNVQGYNLINYNVVCTEETFSGINIAMNGTRLY